MFLWLFFFFVIINKIIDFSCILIKNQNKNGEGMYFQTPLHKQDVTQGQFFKQSLTG